MSEQNSELDYMDAVEAALTDAVWLRVRRFALVRCEMLAKAGLSGDADEMTHDAVNDTFLGSRRWNREKCALHVHLQGVIRSRVSHAFRHALVARHEALGQRHDDDGYDPVEVAVTRRSEPIGNPEQELVARQLVDRTVAAITELARGTNDTQVVAMIEAWRDGVTERPEVAERLGLSTKKVKNARERLMRLAEKLPEELRGVGLGDD